MGIFRKIWAVYAVILFLMMMFLSLPIVLINGLFGSPDAVLRRNIHYLHHIFTPIFLTCIGIRLKITGREKLDPAQSYVIISNHRTSLDFIINAEAFPGVFRFLAKKELQKVPVFGWVVKKMCLTVDRHSAMSRARSVVEIKEQLAKGWSIFIYPEGGRNQTEEPLAPFYDGAFRIAIQTKAPLAVQTICNIRDVSSGSGSDLDLKPGVVHIVWDTPIETSGMKAEDIPLLKERVQEQMIQHLTNHHN